MAYGYPRRRRRVARRPRTFRGRSRSRYAPRTYRTRRSRPMARRRRYASSRGNQRTIRLVVQTVAASPLSLGMKGNAPVRRMF